MAEISGEGLGPRPRLQPARRAYYERAYDGMFMVGARAGTLNQLQRAWGRVGGVYRVRAETLGVPWDVVGALAYRESTWNTPLCLSNGGAALEEDDWLADALQELRDHRMDRLAVTSVGFAADVPAALNCMENWNGTGDYGHGRPSSYLWDNTNWWPGPGRWIADGRWSATAFSDQFGAAMVFKMIRGGV